MTVDSEWASHCLDPENLGTVHVQCKVVKELSMVRTPTDACDGWSIRDRLFGFLVETTSEIQQHRDRDGGKSKKRVARLLGQQEALAYTVALMDDPYRPDISLAIAKARLEVEGGIEG